MSESDPTRRISFTYKTSWPSGSHLAREQARDALLGTDFWSPIAGVEHQIAVLVRKLGLDEGGLDG
jgi:hypothetical protein